MFILFFFLFFFLFFLYVKPFERPELTESMVVRCALLASMSDVEKSVKILVNEANLRLVGLLLPHQSIVEEGAALYEQLFEGPVDPQVFNGGINI